LNLTLGLEDLKGFWIAFAISAIASFPIMKLLVAMKSRQTVSQHAPEGHQLKQGTPTMGGIIILVGMIGAMPFVHWKVSIFPMFLLILLFTVIGFVDDFVIPKLMPGKRGLGWKQKILMQVVAALVPLLIGGFTSPMTLGIAIIVILFFANAYNFSDGLDGLAGTLLIGLLFGMYGISGFGQPLVPYGANPGNLWFASYETSFLFVILGALIPFMYWNAPKAKVFMGDVGSLPIGAFLGGYWFLLRSSALDSRTVTPMTTPDQSMVFYVAIAVWSLMMVAELVPVPLQIASVKLRKKKIFPYTPIHHAFEKAGWPETRVVFVFAISQFIFSMLAITIVAMSK
jgi:phospho-N-acetylmuramoyl-pentapeptide-transferase